MDDATPLEIVELGDAKEETRSTLRGPAAELNEVAPYREI